MPTSVTITAEELKALLAERDAARALREKQEALRGALRLVTAERDLAEKRLRTFRREQRARPGRHAEDDGCRAQAQEARSSQAARS